VTIPLDHNIRIAALYRLSKDVSTTEHERAAAKEQLDKLLNELGLTMADVERIAGEQATVDADEQDDDITAHDLVLVIIDLLREYIWHPNEDVYLISALWVLHTHVYRQFRNTPRIIVYAPLSDSGKTTFLSLLRFLTSGEYLHSPTSATMFRDIHKGIHQTGLYVKYIDEMDNDEFNRHFHRVFNDGWEEGAHVSRVINGDTVRFDTYAPLCFGAISKAEFKLQNLNRSFLLKMHKKGARITKDLVSKLYPSEDIADVRYLIDQFVSTLGGGDPFAGKLNRFPEMPAALIDRDKDRWRPLLSIADACGFGKEARAAALSSEFAIAQPDMKVDLVMDIYKVFVGLTPPHPRDRIWSDTLEKQLHEIHESPWGGEFTGLDGRKQPHKISKGEIGHILRRLWEITPRSIRIGNTTKKGYYLWQFEQAFSDVGLSLPTAVVVASKQAHHKPRRRRKMAAAASAKRARRRKRHSGTRRYK
jgi:hypothetical protein